MDTNPLEEQLEICRAMENPGFYPHAVQSVRRVETHISHVFLAGEFVYKMKKPVNFGFLDFTTLEKREKFCCREVLLNRRLADDIYLGVDKITREAGGYCLNGTGPVAEHVVRMRRIPEGRVMTALLSENRVDDTFVRELADVLTRFYDDSERGPHIDAFGRMETIRKNCDENFRQTEPFAGRILDPHMFHIVRAATEAFLKKRKALFDHRIESGRIRDCHGDLRAEHVYRCDGIRIIDCIEFNDRFRYQDIAADLAFLAMDLDFLGHRRISMELLRTYVDKTHDRDIFTLIDFYKIYRAMVRVKVNCFHLEKDSLEGAEKLRVFNEARRYMKLAYRYAVKIVRPTVWAMCGMIASGKSAVSDALGQSLDIRVLRTDEIRRQLFRARAGGVGETDYSAGVYSWHAISLTYGKQLLAAADEIEGGRSVVLDATFGKARHRRQVVRLAEDGKADLIFIVCECPEAVIRERLAKREEKPGLSDARLRHLDDIRKRFEPFDDVPVSMKIAVDTSRPLEECLEKILSEAYSRLSRRVRELP